jgi:hypothetical protein
MLARIERSIASREFRRLDAIHSTLRRQYSDVFGAGRPIYESRHDIPFLTEFRYAGKTVRQGMVVGPGLPVAHSLVLYNGAPLAHDAFTAVEYRRPDSHEPAHMLVVVREPKLTELEQEILGQLSDAASPFNVGEAGAAWTEVVQAVAVQVVQQVVDYAVDYVVDKAVDVVAAAVVAAVVGEAAQGENNAEDVRAAENGEGPHEEVQVDANVEGEDTDAWGQGMSAAAAELREMEPNVAARALLTMRANLIGTGKATLPSR